MKKLFYLFAAASLIAASVSCNKENANVPGDGRKVDVFVTIHGASVGDNTKVEYSSSRSDNEVKVNSLQVFAFNGQNLEAYTNSIVQGVDPVTSQPVIQAVVPATTGEREIWAVVNAPNLSTVTTLAGLKAATSSLADNSAAHFVMIGSTTQELSSTNDATHPIDIIVRRVVSRVSIKKISGDFKFTMSDARFSVQKIYLINVVGSQPYEIGGTTADGILSGSTTWLNQLGYSASGASGLLYDEFASPFMVTNSAFMTTQHDFYPYPNTYGVTRSAATLTLDSPMGEGGVYTTPFSPRQTMLVIEGRFYENASDLTGVLGYYPIDLPALQRNKCYVIEEVTLSRRPGTEPYKPIETGDAYIQITIQNWDATLSLGTIHC